MNSVFLSKIIRNKTLQHVLFWMISYFVLLRFFAYSSELHTSDWIYAGLFHVPLVIAVYFNLRWFIPKFLNRKKYGFYSVSILVLVVLSALLLRFTFEVLTDIIFPGYYFISYYELLDYAKFAIVYLALTTLLKLSKGWFELYETKQLLERLKSEKLEAEISALKGQVNPHFLFNSLNSIYSLSIENEPVTSDFILKLSDVLRYMIYEANVEKVPLKKEIKYLENYIELQRLRVNENAEILVKIDGSLKDQMIAPLLLIPLVENGFKHGIKGETERAFIHIFIEIEGQEFQMHIKNNKGQVDEIDQSDFKGIGLQNVKRRLELLYPKKHKIDIVETDKTFEVKLKLQLTA